MNPRHMGSRVGKSHVRSLQFHLVSTRSQSVSSHSQSCCPALSFGTKHKRIQQRLLLHTLIPMLIARPGYPVLPVVRGFTFRGLFPHFIQRVGAKGRTTWELIRGLVFWFISPLLAEPIFNQPPLLGGFSPVYTWGRHGLSFYRGTDFWLVSRMR